MDSAKGGNATNKGKKKMNKTAEKIYLYLVWHMRAHGYPPELSDLADRCGCTQTRAEYWLKRLAQQGYIKLYLYEDGDYNVKIMIDEKRGWVVNIHTDERGKPVRITSEIPIHLFVWSPNSVVPVEMVSTKDLITEQLRKAGIKHETKAVPTRQC